AEVLIFAPSIARFRLNWFEDRIASAHLATLALEATPTNMVSLALERELLRHVGGYGVILYKPDSKNLMLSSEMPPKVDAVVDLSKVSFFGLIMDAFSALARTDNRVLEVMGPSPQAERLVIAVVLDEKPLRLAMYGFSERILLLSIVISVFTAALVYLSLHWLMVLPMRRITTAMIAFRDNPEVSYRVIGDHKRGDEIGIAEQELAVMQTRVRAALRQRSHLAALGEAVAKINHDLRNMLATARLVSERLAQSPDPEVKRASPKLERAIDRAVALCSQTLQYVEDRRDLQLEQFRLAAMLREAGQVFKNGSDVLKIEIAENIGIAADRDELFRVFVNLAKNAVEAGAETVTVRLSSAAPVVIEVVDDGPGMPPRAVENLFRPFAGSARSGGTGLGLAIAREVMQAHGGDIELKRTGADGTVFSLTLPCAAAPMREAAE
ncbi:MAG: signal transduction histidine kinase, partial [Alphaproteobacteria bacterium]